MDGEVAGLEARLARDPYGASQPVTVPVARTRKARAARPMLTSREAQPRAEHTLALSHALHPPLILLSIDRRSRSRDCRQHPHGP